MQRFQIILSSTAGALDSETVEMPDGFDAFLNDDVMADPGRAAIINMVKRTQCFSDGDTITVVEI